MKGVRGPGGDQKVQEAWSPTFVLAVVIVSGGNQRREKKKDESNERKKHEGRPMILNSDLQIDLAS